jgi:hypothetical protein
MSDAATKSDLEAIETVGDELSKTAERVASLIAALKVEVVVSVDDQYALPATETLEQVQNAIISSPEVRELIGVNLAAAQVGLDHIDPSNAQDVSDLLANEWADLGEEFHVAARQIVVGSQGQTGTSMTDAEKAAELEGPARLIQLVGTSALLLRLTRKQWIDQSAGLVKQKKHMLVFFDRNFQNENSSEDAGEQLLIDLVGQKLPHVRVALLTKNVENEEEELQRTKALVKTSKAMASDVVVIGKFRLEKSANDFPEALRLLLLANEVEELRSLTLTSIKKAALGAKKSIDELQRYGLVATIAAANEEGTYELDGLVRLAQSAFRRSLLEGNRQQKFATNVLPALRDAAAVELYRDLGSTETQLAKMLWEDQFESGDFLARLGLPIEVGDIFEVKPLTGSGVASTEPRTYILLTQACDLSIRGKGTRAGYVNEFVLHQFKPMPLAADGKLKETSGRMQKVGPFIQGSGHVWGVDFASRITVPDIAVDATVGTRSGESVISASASAPPRPVMSVGWNERLVAIEKEAKKMIELIETFDTNIKEPPARKALKAQAMERLTASITRGSVQPKNGVTAVVNLSAKTITYGIKRIGRVMGPTAVGLVSLSASHLGRPAFEGDIVPASA